MTCDERLEQLLNRCGQTISDLPKQHYAENRSMAFDEALKYFGGNDPWKASDEYILHLTDIIDRMETALENVLGERDYIISTHKGECLLCKFNDDLPSKACRFCFDKVMQNDKNGNWELGELPPEDWSADE